MKKLLIAMLMMMTGIHGNNVCADELEELRNNYDTYVAEAKAKKESLKDSKAEAAAKYAEAAEASVKAKEAMENEEKAKTQYVNTETDKDLQAFNKASDDADIALKAAGYLYKAAKLLENPLPVKTIEERLADAKLNADGAKLLVDDNKDKPAIAAKHQAVVDLYARLVDLGEAVKKQKATYEAAAEEFKETQKTIYDGMLATFNTLEKEFNDANEKAVFKDNESADVVKQKPHRIVLRRGSITTEDDAQQLINMFAEQNNKSISAAATNAAKNTEKKDFVKFKLVEGNEPAFMILAEYDDVEQAKTDLLFLREKLKGTFDLQSQNAQGNYQPVDVKPAEVPAVAEPDTFILSNETVTALQDVAAQMQNSNLISDNVKTFAKNYVGGDNIKGRKFKLKLAAEPKGDERLVTELLTFTMLAAAAKISFSDDVAENLANVMKQDVKGLDVKANKILNWDDFSKSILELFKDVSDFIKSMEKDAKNLKALLGSEVPVQIYLEVGLNDKIIQNVFDTWVKDTIEPMFKLAGAAPDVQPMAIEYSKLTAMAVHTFKQHSDAMSKKTDADVARVLRDAYKAVYDNPDLSKDVIFLYPYDVNNEQEGKESAVRLMLALYGLEKAGLYTLTDDAASKSFYRTMIWTIFNNDATKPILEENKEAGATTMFKVVAGQEDKFDDRVVELFGALEKAATDNAGKFDPTLLLELKKEVNDALVLGVVLSDEAKGKINERLTTLLVKDLPQKSYHIVLKEVPDDKAQGLATAIGLLDSATADAKAKNKEGLVASKQSPFVVAEYDDLVKAKTDLTALGSIGATLMLEEKKADGTWAEVKADAPKVGEKKPDAVAVTKPYRISLQGINDDQSKTLASALSTLDGKAISKDVTGKVAADLLKATKDAAIILTEYDTVDLAKADYVKLIPIGATFVVEEYKDAKWSVVDTSAWKPAAAAPVAGDDLEQVKKTLTERLELAKAASIATADMLSKADDALKVVQAAAESVKDITSGDKKDAADKVRNQLTDATKLRKDLGDAVQKFVQGVEDANSDITAELILVTKADDARLTTYNNLIKKVMEDKTAADTLLTALLESQADAEAQAKIAKPDATKPAEPAPLPGAVSTEQLKPTAADEDALVKAFAKYPVIELAKDKKDESFQTVVDATLENYSLTNKPPKDGLEPVINVVKKEWSGTVYADFEYMWLLSSAVFVDGTEDFTKGAEKCVKRIADYKNKEGKQPFLDYLNDTSAQFYTARIQARKDTIGDKKAVKFVCALVTSKSPDAGAGG